MSVDRKRRSSFVLIRIGSQKVLVMKRMTDIVEMIVNLGLSFIFIFLNFVAALRKPRLRVSLYVSYIFLSLFIIPY